MKNILKKSTTLLIFICFIISIFDSTVSVAQSQGPIQAEFSSYEPPFATDMVNLLTGDFTYNMPIIEIPGPEGGYSLSAFYHAGIMPNQEASWLGLGWNINAGAINRFVKGFPDDWKEITTSVLSYDEGIAGENYEAGVEFAFPGSPLSVGTYVDWGTGKGVGITQFRGFQLGGWSTGFSYGTHGVGISANKPNVQGVNMSWTNQPNGGFKVETNSAQSSLGIHHPGMDNSQSLMSVSNQSIGLAQSISPNNYSSSTAKGKVGLVIPWVPGLSISFAWNNYHYWLFHKNSKSCFGTIYSRDARDWSNAWYWGSQAKHRMMDYYDNPFDATNFNNYQTNADKNSLAFLNYDYYSVTGEGISGSMTPRMYQYGTIFGEGNIFEFNSVGGSKKELGFHLRDDFARTYDKTFFSFDNEPSSYLRVKPGEVAYTGSGDDPFLNWDANSTFESSINGKSSYNSSKDRIGLGKHVEWFTNNDIVQNRTSCENRGFIESPDIDGLRSASNSSDYFDSDGIGAFAITTEDGKTYHYSIPVYQFEEFMISEFKSKPSAKYLENRKLNKYAFTWLLTSITGPDYVDRGQIGIIDNEDYGYYVKFRYGKWTDGYVWRSPYEGYADDSNTAYGTYFYGRKQVYYLNWIQTRTHTAYFIKSLRSDGFGKPIVQTVEHQRNKKEERSFGGLDCGNNNLAWQTYFTQTTETKKITAPEAHKLLKLDKIILLRNGDATISTINPTGYTFKSTSSGEVSIVSNTNVYGTLGQNLPDHVFCEDLYIEPFSCYYQDNVLDYKDIESDLGILESKCLKEIEFIYDYSLCSGTPNSIGGNSEKLTLNSIKIYGKGKTDVFPSYDLTYQYNPNYSNSPSHTDAWGYYIDGTPFHTDAWSLNNINTPTGSEIKIYYQEDTYKYEAALGNIFGSDQYDGGLRVWQIGTTNGTEEFKTRFNYNHPVTGSSSGVTSFAPSSADKYVPYIYEIPGPMVMYGWVTIEEYGKSSTAVSKTRYHFDVLKPAELNPNEQGISYKMGNHFKVQEDQPTTQMADYTTGFDWAHVFGRSATIINNLSTVGRILDISTLSKNDFVTSKTTFRYDDSHTMAVGTMQETFNEIKRYIYDWSDDHVWSSSNWYHTVSSRLSYPNMVLSVENEAKGIKTLTTYNNPDFLTGNYLESSSGTSLNRNYKTSVVPAYQIYSEMGSKVNDINNKNMLSQMAGSYLYTLNQDVNQWQRVSSSVQTWKKNWNTYRYFDSGSQTFKDESYNSANNVWRKHQSYVWKSLVNPDGTIPGDGDEQYVNFDYSLSSIDDHWLRASEVLRYDHFSHPLESKGVNDKTEDKSENYSAVKLGYNNSLVIASASGSNYTGFAYTGAEDIVGTNGFGGEVGGAGKRFPGAAYAHTGNYGIRLGNSGSPDYGFTYGDSDPAQNNGSVGPSANNFFKKNGKYRASVWLKANNEEYGVLYCNPTDGGSIVGWKGTGYQASTTKKFGNWYLLVLDIDLNDPIYVDVDHLTFGVYCTPGIAAGQYVYFDDFRVQPLDANMSANVYDEKTGNVTFILDNDNIATRFDYDQAGRLIGTFRETAQGFKQVSQNIYHSARTPH